MAKRSHSSITLGLCSTNLPQYSAQELLDFMVSSGIPTLELGVGGYPGTIHAQARQLLDDNNQRTWWQQQTQARGLRIGALSCHGNPLHPDAALAQKFHDDFMASLEAANALEVPVVVGFSGQGGTGGTLNWPVVAWPNEYANLHEQQWQEQLIPYWQVVAARAEALGVKIALEMHGGFAVHSPSTLLRLREACGPAIGANLDPSHLWWQLIDPAVAAQFLGPALFHVHLKDVRFNPDALNRHGVLDLTPYSQPDQRAWSFVVPGDGHSADSWQDLIKAIKAADYQSIFSIEHEAPMPVLEGIRRCLDFMATLE